MTKPVPGLGTRIHNLAEQVRDLFIGHHGTNTPAEVHAAVDTLQEAAARVDAPDQTSTPD